MNKKLHFKVSARTARLIGRENVANAESAITELVKNSYDADANHCVLFFDKNSTLHILDDGHGMDAEVIEDHWMTIGTNNKQVDFVTKNERIKSGEKGIGRFALDRLGSACKLYTKPSKGSLGFIWTVDWSDFEKESLKTVEEMQADLRAIHRLDLNAHAKQLFSKIEGLDAELEELNFQSGAFISIQQLRDEWEHFHFQRLYNSLVTLVPPKEETSFNIYLFCESFPNAFGKIEVSPCDDFDYKVSARIDETQTAHITIHRNEIDLKALSKDLFRQAEMKSFPFDRKTFYKDSFKIKRKLSTLMSGFKDVDNTDILSRIGPFSFTFYFMKKQTSLQDKERFYYKDFNVKLRNAWLDEHAGIKVFRDGFRVRPYGEPKGPSFDWLGLGIRYASNPAGVSRSGDYRVRDHNLSGVVKISRVQNPLLQDKSSREGIVENRAFDVFKQIILSIISLFEDDRSHIAEQLKALHRKKNPRELAEYRATAASKKAREKKFDKDKTDAEKDREALAEHAENLQEQIEELLNEQKILRVLASSGAMFAAFGHELHAMQTDIMARANTLRSLFEPYLDPAEALNMPDEHNPWIYVDEIETLDDKLLHWMKFALSGIRKDKRNRRNIYFKKYFDDFKDMWSSFLDERQISFRVDVANDDIKMKAFEVELDSIFNNLLINSVEVFNSKRKFEKREIVISCGAPRNTIEILYKDSGPGISKDIENPNKIFDLFYSTKRDPNTGKLIGTGIGMYLVKSIVNEYKGTLSLGRATKGFSIKLNLPIPG